MTELSSHNKDHVAAGLDFLGIWLFQKFAKLWSGLQKAMEKMTIMQLECVCVVIVAIALWIAPKNEKLLFHLSQPVTKSTKVSLTSLMEGWPSSACLLCFTFILVIEVKNTHQHLSEFYSLITYKQRLWIQEFSKNQKHIGGINWLYGI